MIMLSKIKNVFFIIDSLLFWFPSLFIRIFPIKCYSANNFSENVGYCRLIPFLKGKSMRKCSLSLCGRIEANIILLLDSLKSRNNTIYLDTHYHYHNHKWCHPVRYEQFHLSHLHQYHQSQKLAQGGQER